MKTILFIFIVLTVLVSCSDNGIQNQSPVLSNKLSIESDNNPTVRLVTFNIAAGRFASLENIARAIRTLDADIIVIQEVDVLTNRSGKVDQPVKLADLTGLNVKFAKAIDFDGGEYGIAIASKHPMNSIKKFMLPSGDREQRILLTAQIDVPGLLSPIVVFGTHLDNIKDSSIRIKQIKQINTIATQLSGVKLLLGDMNSVPGSPEYNLISDFWHDTVTDKVLTAPANNPKKQIDYIFIDNKNHWRIIQSNVPVKQSQFSDIDWESLTDHLPVYVDLRAIK